MLLTGPNSVSLSLESLISGLDTSSTKDVMRPTPLPSFVKDADSVIQVRERNLPAVCGAQSAMCISACGHVLSVLVQVACGASHTVALTQKNNIWSFGDNSLGQLGIGTKLHSKLMPHKIALDGGSTWKAISAGRAHTLALASSGAVYAWGQV